MLLGILGLSTSRGISHMSTDVESPDMACCSKADILSWAVDLVGVFVVLRWCLPWQGRRRVLQT